MREGGVNFVASCEVGFGWPNWELHPGFHQQFEAMSGVTDSPLVCLSPKSF
jgi:hypothetical protein